MHVVPLLLAAASVAAAPSGFQVRLEGPGNATVEFLEPYKVRISVDRAAEPGPRTLHVEVPHGLPDAWPAPDVEVRDEQGRAVVVTHIGIEWAKFHFPAPAARSAYFVQVVGPVRRPALPTEADRQVTDSVTGLRFAIPRWYDGRQAALSIRFDDSHPTHVITAVPILREYGFRTTFMVNPGGREPGSRRRSSFEDHRAEWEACARSGDHEFANHSFHHRGAEGDEDAESEIGDAAKAIWELFPTRSRLLALNLGGGTAWKTSRTLRYYLDKYHLFDASSDSTGMDDKYGDRVENFRRMLEQRLAAGGWLQIHYHSIGPGLASSEANFRAVLDIVKEHASRLWIAGMADIHKCRAEREASKLEVVSSSPRRVTLRLACASDRKLYDQPLTIEATPPESWRLDRIEIRDQEGKRVATRIADRRLRFDAAPQQATFTVTLR
jgi:hypothetical protein